MQLRRFEKILTFPERLSELAQRLRSEAKAMPPGKNRDDLLQKGQQAENAALFEWLSSPELQWPN